MKKLISLLILVAVNRAQAQIEMIAVPTQNNPKVMTAISNHNSVKSYDFLFSESERVALRSLGQEPLSLTLKLVLKSEVGAQALKTWISVNGLPIRLEEGLKPLQLSRDPLIDDQWGVKNEGKKQLMFFDDYSSLKLSAVAGEQINSVQIKPKSGKKIVAVLDSGLDINHRDLKNQIYKKPGECKLLEEYNQCLADKNNKAADCHKKFAEQDSDGNGYPLDCNGWNFIDQGKSATKVRGSPEMRDDKGHGTHVAGIIAAERNNNYGIAGCTDNAQILPVRILNDDPRSPMRPQAKEPIPESTDKDLNYNPKDRASMLFDSDFLARGILYAIRSKAHVINMSFGWPANHDSFLVRKMVALAQQEGIIVVAAAGNDSTDTLVMPCLYPGVICVGSHNPDGSISPFSNYGSGVSVSAPGFRVLSTYPLQLRNELFTDLAGFEFKEGTSMATPFVSCAVAEMLGQDFKADEIQARLVLGARPHREVLTPELKKASPRFTLGGNLDIQKSLTIGKQPLILPVKKEPLQILWNGGLGGSKFSIGLKNYWDKATNVKVKVTINPKFTQPTLSLSNNEWSINEWPEGEFKDFTPQLNVQSQQFESELLFDLTISADNISERKITLQSQVSVAVNGNFAELGAKSVPVKGVVLTEDTSLRTVTSWLPSSSQDYMTVDEKEKKVIYGLIKENGGIYEKIASIEIDAVTGGLLFLISKIDVDLNSRDDYVFIYQIRTPKAYQFAFLIFDENLKPLNLPFKTGPSNRYLYPGEFAAMPKNFQWVRQNGYMFPAWVINGSEPESTKPDPWKLRDKPFPRTRVYGLGLADLTIVTEVEGYSIAQKLSANIEQKQKGIMPVILNKGEDYLQEYAIGEFYDGKVQNVTPLTLQKFRQFVAEQSTDIIPLKSTTDHSGTAFFTRSYAGKLRVTWINSGGITLDTMLEPAQLADSVLHVIGSFSGNLAKGVFTQTHSEMQYHDLNRGTIGLSSLNRYSFMSSASFAMNFYPVVSWANDFNEKMPGVLIPPWFGTNASSFVIVPVYSKAGELEKLSRPASLRFSPAKGCEAIGNPVEANDNSPSLMMFFCGDKFIKIPLAY